MGSMSYHPKDLLTLNPGSKRRYMCCMNGSRRNSDPSRLGGKGDCRAQGLQVEVRLGFMQFGASGGLWLWPGEGSGPKAVSPKQLPLFSAMWVFVTSTSGKKFNDAFTKEALRGLSQP